MPLTAAALNQLNLESGVRALWSEFLLGHFNGGTRAVGDSAAVLFPAFAGGVRFDVGPAGGDASVPLDGAELRVLGSGTGRSQRRWNAAASPAAARGKTVFEDTAFLFSIRARKTDWGATNQLADLLAERLGAILRNPVTAQPLAQKGISHLRPRRAQTLADAAGHTAVRLIYCPARLTYALSWDETA